MRLARVSLAVAVGVLTVGLGAASEGAEFVLYSWSGRVRPASGAEDPWNLGAHGPSGAPFTLRAFVPADATDVDGTQNPGFARFVPDLVILEIGDDSATSTGAEIRVQDDDSFDSVTFLAQVELFGTTLLLVSSVRLPVATFALADPPARDLPPVFADTTPVQLGASGTGSLSTAPDDDTVTGRFEECGESPVRVDWTSPTAGTADGIDVTLAGLDAHQLNDAVDVQGPDFAAAPLCSTAPLIEYRIASDWTATLSAPVGALFLYARAWRGSSAGVDPVTYQFDAPFTIASGLAAATVANGDTLLSLPATDFHDGILRFEGPIQSLGVDSNSTSGSVQGMTFAIVPAPEPGAGTAALALTVLLTLRRRSLR